MADFFGAVFFLQLFEERFVADLFEFVEPDAVADIYGERDGFELSGARVFCEGGANDLRPIGGKFFLPEIRGNSDLFHQNGHYFAECFDALLRRRAHVRFNLRAFLLNAPAAHVEAFSAWRIHGGTIMRRSR